MGCPTSPDYPVAETAGRVLPCRIVQSDKNEALGTLLAQVAKGEVPLSALAVSSVLGSHSVVVTATHAPLLSQR